MNFDDIRPYTDAEMRAIMPRIAAAPQFEAAAAYLFPDRPIDQLRHEFCSFDTIDAFQHTVMLHVIQRIEQTTISQFTFDGVDLLRPDCPYLYISNHRDITLDAYLLLYAIWHCGFPSAQITFGANLMQQSLVADFGRCNKMFRVERGGTPKEFYLALSRLSAYIRHVIAEEHESVWIAQRNGRTKNGIDRTDAALVKMLGLSGGKDKVAAYESLHIVPVSIAYEWEPCDILKAVELCRTHDGHYTKSEGEDLRSVLTGIQSPKGHVHISIGRPVDAADLSALPQDNTFHNALAELLDRRILGGFLPMANHYIAADIRSGSHAHAQAGRYSAEQRLAFEQRLSALPLLPDVDPARLRAQFLDIYANSLN